MSAAPEETDDDGCRRIFSNDNRFANFMFELERLAAADAAFDHDFKEWLEMATMAWGTVQGTTIKMEIIPGPPPQQPESTK